MAAFERYLIAEPEAHLEKKNAYYRFLEESSTAERILEAFGLEGEDAHIINGHVPVKVRKGESPVKAGGKAIIIDGGFCKAYHKKTGISGYTLISNSRGLRLLEHQKIADYISDHNFDRVMFIGDNFSRVKTKYPRFKNLDHLKEYLEKDPVEDSYILLKGSRGVQLEKCIDML